MLPFWHESKQDRNAWQKKNISLCCHVFSARMLHNNWLLGPSRTFVPKENYSDSGKAEERQHLKTLSGFWFCILRMYTRTCIICLVSERSKFTWKASQFYTAGASEKIELFLDWRSVVLTLIGPIFTKKSTHKIIIDSVKSSKSRWN